MSRRRDDFRHRPRIVGERDQSQRFPRAGDRVADGIGGEYWVVAVSRTTKRLLLRDPDGDVFPIRSFRLQSGPWHLVTEQQRKRDGQRNN